MQTRSLLTTIGKFKGDADTGLGHERMLALTRLSCAVADAWAERVHPGVFAELGCVGSYSAVLPLIDLTKIVLVSVSAS